MKWPTNFKNIFFNLLLNDCLCFLKISADKIAFNFFFIDHKDVTLCAHGFFKMLLYLNFLKHHYIIWFYELILGFFLIKNSKCQVDRFYFPKITFSFLVVFFPVVLFSLN